ncbi:MAG: hypothetical protein KDI19_15190, partial [Pseudomonadales bacterium]|nr:hypothetical protein [Pseudomonadales bacterium]
MSEMITKLWRRLPSRGKTAASLPVIESADPNAVPLVPDSSRYNNREISDLQFIERVLEEAHNPSHPLLERLRFLAISASVLDQFHAVRVAKLRRAAKKTDAYITPDGMTPAQQLRAVMARARALMRSQSATWETIRAQLAQVDIHLCEAHELDTGDVMWLHDFFRRHVLPVLTPSIIDEEHPFPFIPSGGVCTILEFSDRHILIPLPERLSRFIQLPGERVRFITLETLVFRFWTDLFPGDSLRSHGVFQILRDNDLARQERADDLRSIVEFGLRMRHKANAILLKVADSMSETSLRFIAHHLDIYTDDELAWFEQAGKPLSDTSYIHVLKLPGMASLASIITSEVASKYHGLLFAPHTPREVKSLADGVDVFEAIAAKDILVHWPFESFDTVVRFLKAAADDPGVVAIKQTLYRTSDDSPVVDALAAAARNGKAVTTIIE